MVRPGLVNLDFADVETIMKGMGKAMMGTGEAEGEKRAEEATNAALNNPLIDEYSLKGAKGLLVNITGGNDLTMFEVDEAVNKIRAEVDPEADLIFGSIEDETLNGKIRVSIVATSLDGQSPQTKPIISMVHRLQSRNNGYANNTINRTEMNQPTLNATDGATALNLNTIIEENTNVQQKVNQEASAVTTTEASLENVSIENTNYLQNIENIKESDDAKAKDDIPSFEVDSIELATPELFSNDPDPGNNLINQDNVDENEFKEPDVFENDVENSNFDNEIKEPEMFEESNLEEDFEIPAFLRKQKN
jgi:cell division protein FtsZ